MNYGNAIRVVRSSRGWSQKDLARRAKLDSSYISLLETGRRVPSMAAIENLASVLKVPVYLLVLLASQKADLRGIGANDAQELGARLLGVLIDAQGTRR